MSRNHASTSDTREPRELDPKWYTVAQVAQLLGYGETKVRMLIISDRPRGAEGLDGLGERCPSGCRRQAYVRHRRHKTDRVVIGNSV